MEDSGGMRFDSLGNAVRKKRSQTSRRPRPESQPVSEGPSSLSSTPSDDAGKASSDENTGFDPNSKRKEFNLNHYVSRASAVEDENCHMKSKMDGEFHRFYNNEPGHGLYNKRCSEGVLAPAGWKGSSKFKDSLESESRSEDIYDGSYSEGMNLGLSGFPQDESGNDNKVKKVKLKVCGVTRTIQANSTSNGLSRSGSTAKSSRLSDASRPRQNQQVFHIGNDDSFCHHPLQYLTSISAKFGVDDWVTGFYRINSRLKVFSQFSFYNIIGPYLIRPIYVDFPIEY